jgi:hypothetical protein
MHYTSLEDCSRLLETSMLELLNKLAGEIYFVVKCGLRGCLVPLVFLTTITSNVWTHAWSVKYRLIMKLIAD